MKKLENIKIVKVNDSNKWFELFEQFEDANIYQTWNYSSIVQNEKQPEHLAFYHEDELIGIAQVRIKTIPVFQRGIAYTFSGPLWRKKNNPAKIENFSLIIEALLNEYVINKKLVLRIRPFIFSDENSDLNQDDVLFNRLNFKRLDKNYSSLLLNMNNDLDTINKSLRPRWRNYLNQSLKNDLKIVSGYTPELYSTFVGLYGQMMERKDFREYVDPVKIGKLNELLKEEYKLKIFIAYKDNNAVAGLVGTAIGNTGIYLLGATNDSGLELRASYLLHWEMIKWMKSMNCLRYDLGGINKERNPGGFKFKSGISNMEITDIGTFENNSSLLSNLILKAGEKIKKN